MNDSKFAIMDAVKYAYAFVGKEWLYLIKLGSFPMTVQIIISLITLSFRPDASFLEGYLWTLPATFLFASFTFLQTRLILFGERMENLPVDPAYLAHRLRCMKISIFSYLLFNMGITLFLLLLITVAAATKSHSSMGGFVLILLLGPLFWAIRFSVAPIVGAVGYPIKAFLLRVNDMTFSARLFAMGFFCFLPVFFLSQLLMSPFIPLMETKEVADTLKNMTSTQRIATTSISAFTSLLMISLLNAAAINALQQILGSRQGRRA